MDQREYWKEIESLAQQVTREARDEDRDTLPSKEWSAHPCDCCWSNGDGPRVAACIVGASDE